MIVTKPQVSEILCNSVTATTAGVITIPANRWYTCTISLSVTVTIAGTSTPTVTFNSGTSTGAAPVNGTVIAGISAAGLANATGQESNTVDCIVFGGSNGATLDYAVTNQTAARCTINGFLL